MKNSNTKKTNGIKFSVYSSIMMIGLIFILILINYFITTLDNTADLSLDMTSQRLYSISGATEDVLNRLEEDVFIYTTETAGIEDLNVSELLGNYASMSDRIHLINIDIVKNPAVIDYYNEFSNYDVTVGCVIVSNSPDTNDESQRYRILDYNDLYIYDEAEETYTEFSAEDAITNAIKYIENPNNQAVWILDNHSTDNTAIMGVKAILEDENYQVSLLDILNGQNPINKGDVVIVLSPESDLTLAESEILNSFLDDGGKMIASIDPALCGTEDVINLVSLVERYNVKLGQGIVMETNLDNIAVSGDNEYMYSFVIPNLAEHEITNDFIVAGYKLLLGRNAGYLVLPSKTNDDNIIIEPLLNTSQTSFVEPWSAQMDGEADDDAQYGEFTVLAALTDTSGETDTKLIISSAPELFAYAEEYSQSVYKNKDFFLKCVSWLNEDNGEFYISSKPLSHEPLMIATMREAHVIIAVVCALIPLIIFGFGIFIFIRRNNL